VVELVETTKPDLETGPPGLDKLDHRSNEH